MKKFLVVSSLVLLLVILVSTLFYNSEIKRVEKSRNPTLDLYESTKLWVIEDIRSYLLVKSLTDYDLSKDLSHMAPDIKDSLYGASYNKEAFSSASSVSFIDAQYTLQGEQKGVLLIYLLAEVKTGETSNLLNFLVFVKENTISDVLVY
jgi:hypothetical protein